MGCHFDRSSKFLPLLPQFDGRLPTVSPTVFFHFHEAVPHPRQGECPRPAHHRRARPAPADATPPATLAAAAGATGACFLPAAGAGRWPR